jgi:hypothetical protein
MFTDLLTRYIAMYGYSYYVLHDSVDSGSLPGTPEQELDRLEAAGREVRAALWRKQLPPVAYVGLAEGAVVAARLVNLEAPREDSLPYLPPSKWRAGKAHLVGMKSYRHCIRDCLCCSRCRVLAMGPYRTH